VGVLADRLDSMHIRAATPDGTISARLNGRTNVVLSFAPGYYDQCSERDLERRLALLATLLWAGRMRAFYAALSEAYEQTITGEDRPISPRDVEYAELRDALVAQGRSADNRITVSVRGMREWNIRVKDGTAREIDEHAFAAAVGEAAAELIRDQFAQIALLKNRVYG
jgi:hypothetical protein